MDTYFNLMKHKLCLIKGEMIHECLKDVKY